MITKRILMIFFLLLAGKSWAQTDFRPGFIISHEGDSIYGKIDYRGDRLMASVCRFIPDGAAEMQEFSPYELSAYRFSDSKYFISKEVSTGDFKGKVFLEYLLKGKLNVYYFRGEDKDHYLVEKEGGDLIELPYEEKVTYIDNTPHLFKSSTHKGILKNLTSDAPSFERRINRLKEPAHENLTNLARDYHNAVCKEEDCFIYQKKGSLINVSLEPVYGFIKYQELDNLVNEAGAHAYFWMPRKNEKLYFKTGYLFNRFTAGGNNYKVSKFPLQIQYLYPSGNFRPKLNFGANYYSVIINNYLISRFYTLHLGTGLHYKLSKNFFLSTNISSEFEPLFFKTLKEKPIGYKKISYNFNFGVYITL